MIKYKYIYILIPCCLIGGLLQAQSWQLVADSAVQVSITGTSSLHDWTVTTSGVQDVPSSLTFDGEQQIADFSFKVPVSGMDGGRGSSMNKKIVEAFKSAEHPLVHYDQTQPANVVKSGDSYEITSAGTLSMAGAEKSVTVQCTASIENGTLIISGNQNIKMSDYNMTPPSAMFGQIKTHDDVVVNFQFRYTKQ